MKIFNMEVKEKLVTSQMVAWYQERLADWTSVEIGSDFHAGCKVIEAFLRDPTESPSPNVRTEADPVSEMFFLVFMIPDDGQCLESH
jgi:hypothetical protein